MYSKEMAEIQSFAAILDVDWWDLVPMIVYLQLLCSTFIFKLFSVKKYDRQSNFGHFYNLIITISIINFINILDPKDHLETCKYQSVLCLKSPKMWNSVQLSVTRNTKVEMK